MKKGTQYKRDDAFLTRNEPIDRSALSISIGHSQHVLDPTRLPVDVHHQNNACQVDSANEDASRSEIVFKLMCVCVFVELEVVRSERVDDDFSYINIIDFLLFFSSPTFSVMIEVILVSKF